jgi:hypothetical protein
VSRETLQRVATVELLGEKLDIAKNGHFHLVRMEMDDYGEPRAIRLHLRDWLSTGDVTAEYAYAKVQALLDLLGETLAGLRSQRDARLGVGNGGG